MEREEEEDRKRDRRSSGGGADWDDEEERRGERRRYSERSSRSYHSGGGFDSRHSGGDRYRQSSSSNYQHNRRDNREMGDDEIVRSGRKRRYDEDGGSGSGSGGGWNDGYNRGGSGSGGIGIASGGVGGVGIGGVGGVGGVGVGGVGVGVGGSSKRMKYGVEEGHDRDIEESLHNLIYHVGDSLRTANRDVEGLVKAIQEDAPLFMEEIVESILQCVYHLPHRCSLYATLVGLLHVRIRPCGFAKYLVRTVLDDFQESLEESNYCSGLVKLRFLCLLGSVFVVSLSDIVLLFRRLLAVTKERNISQAKADQYAHLVLNCLLWVGRDVYDESRNDMAGLLDVIDTYMRRRDDRLISPLRVFQPSDREEESQIDLLYVLYRCIRDENKRGWKIRALEGAPQEYYFAELRKAKSVSVPHFVAPDHLSSSFSAKTLLQGPVFTLFNDYYVRSQYLEIEFDYMDWASRLIVRQSVLDVIHSLLKDPKLALQHILSFPFKEAHYHLIVETLLGELLRLPLARSHAMVCSNLLINLCKASNQVPPILAECIERLFANIHNMDRECFDRLAEWMALHLSNFQFQWNWNSWAWVVSDFEALSFEGESGGGEKEEEGKRGRESEREEGKRGRESEREEGGEKKKRLAELTHRRLFIIQVISHMVRLSYAQRIAETLPDIFRPLIFDTGAMQLTLENIPPIATDLTSPLSSEEAGVVLSSVDSVFLLMRQKVPSEQLLDQISSIFETKCAQIRGVVLALTKFGSKSISHLMTSLERYLPALSSLIQEPEDRSLVLECVRNVWEKSPQYQILLCDKLMTIRVVDNFSIINWVFSKDESDDFCRSFLWEILHNTIQKTLARTETLAQMKQEEEGNLSIAKRKLFGPDLTTEESYLDMDEAGDSSSSSSSSSVAKSKTIKKSAPSPDTEKEIERLEKEVQKLNVGIEAAQREKKQLFLVVFQRFSISITNHLNRIEAEEAEKGKEKKEEGEGKSEIERDGDESMDPKDEEEQKGNENGEGKKRGEEEEEKEKKVVGLLGPERNSVWLSVVSGHLLETGRKYYQHLGPLLDTLSTLFTDDVDPLLSRIFDSFRRLVEVYSHYQSLTSSSSSSSSTSPTITSNSPAASSSSSSSPIPSSKEDSPS